MGRSELLRTIGSLALLLVRAEPAWAQSSASSAEDKERQFDPQPGFTTLAMVYAPHVRVDHQQLIHDAEAWAEAWEWYGFRGELPNVDFGKRWVLVFVEADPCSGGGRGGSPLVTMRPLSTGKLVPQFLGPEPDQISCPDMLVLPRRRGHAYAVAVPQREPAPRVAARDKMSLPPRARSDSNCAGCELDSPVVEELATDGTVPLPAAGQTLLVRLRDGTPIWVLRHTDGSTTALAADYEPHPEWLPGLRVPAVWDPRQRSFGCCDEQGTHLTGIRAGLARHRIEIWKERIWIGPRGRPAPPAAPRAVRVPRPGETNPWRGPFDALPPGSLGDARRSRAGAWTLVRSLRLSVGPDGARVCEPRGDGCVPVTGFAVPKDCSGTFFGTAALQRTARGFEAPVWLWFDNTYGCTVDDRFQGMSTGYIQGVERLTFAATASGSGGWAGSRALFGAGLTGTMRYRPRYVPQRSFWQHQLGETLELSVRGRLLSSDGATADRGGVWMLGLAPVLGSRPPFQKLTSPTLLSLVIPEFGIASHPDATGTYVSWRWAIEYRVVEASYRQHPYTVSDRLAIEIAPAFVMFSTDRSAYLGELSFGVTAW